MPQLWDKSKVDSPFQKMQITLFNKFTAKLEIPCYKKLTCYYYYDVLEAFSRHLF